VDYKDERAAALRWLDRFGDPFVRTAFDGDGRIGIEYGVYGVPETYLIDAAGRIRYKHVGPLTDDVLQDAILPLIERLKHEQA
jgi:cytochrome c biogenesis protein CcmG/thiol:disulfide interchange protein DsbE